MFGRYPVTSVMLLVSGCMLAARWEPTWTDPLAQVAHYFPGALQKQELVAHREINGHFQLWSGEWWRLWGSAFHHAGLWHLCVNAIGLGSCGAVLERRMGYVRYGLFFIFAAGISMLPEVYVESDAVGLSGVFYALFGAMLMLRTRDPEVAQLVSAEFIVVCFACLFGCVAVSMIGESRIANGAHLVGLVYGAIIGWLVFGFRRQHGGAAFLLNVILHLFIALFVVAAMLPVWNGRYYAWLAWQKETKNAMAVDTERLWSRATKLSPRLALPWQRLSEIHEGRHEWLVAWRLLLEGAQNNRLEDQLLERARVFWDRLPDERARTAAAHEFARLFGDESRIWLRRIKLEAAPEFAEALEAIPDPNAGPAWVLDQDRPPPSLDVEVQLPIDVIGITRPASGEKSVPEIDPNAPDGARLGERL